MEQFKKMKVIMLPTKDNSNISKDIITNELSIDKYKVITSNAPILKPQHLYIISDNEIKEGDWYIGKHPTKILQHTKEGAIWAKDKNIKVLKIEATTDSSLNLSHTCFGTMLKGECTHILPKIPQLFVELFVEQKGNVTEVEVKISNQCCKGVLKTTDDIHFAYCVEECKGSIQVVETDENNTIIIK